MSGNLLPLFLSPVTANGTNGVSGTAQFGSNAPTQFDSNYLFGSLLNQAMNAKNVPGALKPLTTATLGAFALGGSAGVSDLGSLFLNKVAANFNTNTAGLQAQFQQMLANGQSLQSIIAQLASQLAGMVSDASSLDNGASGIVARNRLMQAFSQALAPPGTAPPTAAKQAAALAQRFVQVANIVAGAAQSQDVGQQYRYPGSSLDANSAKVSPAPDAKQTDPSLTASALASSIQANLSAALSALPSGLPSTATSGTSPLQSAISALFAGGATPAAVVKTLASNLGNAVASAAGTDNATTAGLQAAFAQRLSVPAGATPDQAAAQLAAQATAIVQQAAAHITGGATAGQAVTALAPSVASSASGGTDVLQRILQRAQNATVVAGGTAQPQSNAPNGVAATSGQGGANTNANANLTGLLAQAAAPAGGSSAQTSVDAFLASFTQAMTDLRTREDAASSADASPVSAPANGTQAFLASIGTVDQTQTAFVAPATPMAAPNPTDPNNVVDQILKGISLRNGIGDGTEVRMKLQPENLGDVHVKLNVDNGNVSATFIASTADVRDTLLANSGQLTRQFAEAGLKLQQFSVDVGGGQGNPFAQQQQQFASNSASTRGLTTSADDEEVDGVQSAVPTFGPPILTGVNRGLLDYLV